MEQNKEAEQAWVYQSNRRWHEKEANPKAFDDPYIQGITDFKASLKEAIEKEKKKLSISDQQSDAVRFHQLGKVLELLETVKPKE